MPRLSDRIDHGALPDFDDFYLTSRRRLVLSAYALTGDLSAARNAVGDAFVAARHHWRKVGRLPDPEEWVRPRAWAMAQRRHVARLWHREKGIGAEQKAVLDALHHLPDQQRKVLLLAHLAALSTADIGRELGETRARVEERLAGGDRGVLPGDRHRSPTSVGAAIESLAPIAEAAALPAPAVIHRGGRRRRLLHTVGGAASGGRADDPRRRVRRARRGAGGPGLGGYDAGRHPAGDRRDAAQPPAGAAARPRRQLARAGDLRQHHRQRDQLGVPGDPLRRPARQGHDGAHLHHRRCRRGPPPGGADDRDLAVGEGVGGGVPHDARLVRRLQPGPAAAAERLPGAGSRRRGADAQAAHPQRRTPHLRRGPGPHRLPHRLDGLRDARRSTGRRRPRGDHADRRRPQRVLLRPVGPVPDSGPGRTGAAAPVGRDPGHPRGRRPPGDRPDQPALGGHPAGAGAAEHRRDDLRQGRLRARGCPASRHAHLPDPGGAGWPSGSASPRPSDRSPRRPGRTGWCAASPPRWSAARRRTSGPR